MTHPKVLPKILIVSRRLTRKDKPINWISEAHLSLLLKEKIIPVFVPLVKEILLHLNTYTKEMDGLLMVEGGDVSPTHYNTSVPKKGLQELDPLFDFGE